MSDKEKFWCGIAVMVFFGLFALSGVAAMVASSNAQDGDPSPVIHGSADQTIMPTPTATNTTYRPRDLRGYPISRLPEATK